MRYMAWQNVLLRGVASLVLASGCLLNSGCALGELGQKIADSTASMFRPSHHDYFDETDRKEDEWSAAGKEGRGDRPFDHESDGLTNLMSSPKAQGIERNLGID